MKGEISTQPPRAFQFDGRPQPEMPGRQTEGRQTRHVKVRITEASDPAFYPAPLHDWPRVFPGL